MNEKSKKASSAVRQNMAENNRRIRNFILQKGKAKRTEAAPYSANPERVNHVRFPQWQWQWQWRGTQVASHLPRFQRASLGEMLSPNTLCGNTKNFGGKNYREENSKTKQTYNLFFPRIGAGTAHHR